MTDRDAFVAALLSLVCPGQEPADVLASQNLTGAAGSDQSALLYPSESDYPLTVILWEVDSLTLATLRQQLSLAPDTPIEERSLETFFSRVVGDAADAEPEIGSAESDSVVGRYRALRDLLTIHLTHPEVYRVGQVEVDVYVVGQFAPGMYAGVATRVVET